MISKQLPLNPTSFAAFVMYLFFDTETTGLPRSFIAPESDFDNWPRLVQIAWILCDEKGGEVSRKSLIIKPEGFTIPEDAVRIHKITTEMALDKGIPLAEALSEFNQATLKADVLIAHNIAFDQRIIGAEFLRKDIPSGITRLKPFCTMLNSTEFCKLPSYRGWKPPRLYELHMKLFSKGFERAHDALADTEACMRCFFELKNKGVVKI